MNFELIAKPVTVTDCTFDRAVFESDVLVLVDFWARWFGPCRIVGPTLEDLAADYGGRIKIAKLDVDENPLTAYGFGIRSIPTLVLVKDGEVREAAVGALSKAEIMQLVDRNLQ